MSDFDINIVVNGSRCKQYHHEGKIFIEAKEGSEYSIEIKNNTWQRIMAVCSVDGLDILTGKAATEDGAGYVMNGYASNKFDGFRVSDDTVAKFIFSNKDKKDSYAHSKEDGSEANVGVIGVRLFREVQRQFALERVTEYLQAHPLQPRRRTYDSGTPYWGVDQPTIWCSSVLNDEVSGANLYSCNDIPVRSDISTSKIVNQSLSSGVMRSANLSNMSAQLCSAKIEPEPKGFDMATKWGEAKESKVVEVTFEKGVLGLTMDIYYASRQSLIEMGVPIGPEKQVAFPKSFKDSKYAQPPKGWKA
jgi:hypothetical protein